MRWSSAVTRPGAIDGSPPLPPALPSPTTASLTARSPAWPIGAGGQPGHALDLDQRDVGRDAVAEHLRRVHAAVGGVLHPQLLRVGDDVVVRERETVRRDDDAGAGGRAARREPRGDVHDRVVELRGDAPGGRGRRSRTTRSDGKVKLVGRCTTASSWWPIVYPTTPAMARANAAVSRTAERPHDGRGGRAGARRWRRGCGRVGGRTSSSMSPRPGEGVRPPCPLVAEKNLLGAGFHARDRSAGLQPRAAGDAASRVVIDRGSSVSRSRSMREPFFHVDGDDFLPTQLCQGPWDPGSAHGGPPSALLARAIERHEPDDSLAIGRVLLDLLRPVPLAPLRISTATIRPGRRVQIVEATMTAADGTELVRARALRIRRIPSEVDAPGAGIGAGAVRGARRTRHRRRRGQRPTCRDRPRRGAPPGRRSVPGAGSRDRVVPTARAARRRGGAVADPAGDGRRRLRQRDQPGARRRVRVHQSRPRRALRAGAGRRMDRTGRHDAHDRRARARSRAGRSTTRPVGSVRASSRCTSARARRPDASPDPPRAAPRRDDAGSSWPNVSDSSPITTATPETARVGSAATPATTGPWRAGPGCARLRAVSTPMHHLEPVGLDFLTTAPVRFDFTASLPAPTDVVFAAISADPSTWTWFPGLTDARYDSAPPHGVGTLPVGGDGRRRLPRDPARVRRPHAGGRTASTRAPTPRSEPWPRTGSSRTTTAGPPSPGRSRSTRSPSCSRSSRARATSSAACSGPRWHRSPTTCRRDDRRRPGSRRRPRRTPGPGAGGA